MNAGELFEAGRLGEAIQAQVEEVRAHPADPDRRLFLFELLVFAGDLDRARIHIEAIRYGEVERDAAVTAYCRVLDAEVARRKLFDEGLGPGFLAAPAAHVQMRFGALDRLRVGETAEAEALLAEANAAIPALSGLIDGRPFASLRDPDDLFGTVLEVMAEGNYYWVPLENVRTLEMNSPRYPRDLIWIPARLESEYATGDVYLPLYPGTHEHADDRAKLGRLGDWRYPGGELTLGVGSRSLLADEDVVGLLDVRKLTIDRVPESAAGQAGTAGP